MSDVVKRTKSKLAAVPSTQSPSPLSDFIGSGDAMTSQALQSLVMLSSGSLTTQAYRHVQYTHSYRCDRHAGTCTPAVYLHGTQG